MLQLFAYETLGLKATISTFQNFLLEDLIMS